MAAAIADEGAVAALIPKLDTLFNLLALARLELRNGTLLDLMTLRPRVRSKDFRKALDKTLTLRRAVPVSGARGAVATRAIRGDERARTAARRPTGTTSSTSYDLSNAFYALFLDPDDLQLRAISPTGQRPARRAARQARHDLPQAAADGPASHARHRLRLGGAGLPRRAALRRLRPWRNAGARSNLILPRRGSRGSACRTG